MTQQCSRSTADIEMALPLEGSIGSTLCRSNNEWMRNGSKIIAHGFIEHGRKTIVAVNGALTTAASHLGVTRQNRLAGARPDRRFVYSFPCANLESVSSPRYAEYGTVTVIFFSRRRKELFASHETFQ